MIFIDRWVIHNLEKICHWFQKLTGKTNYWILGKVSLALFYIMLSAFMFHCLGGRAPNWLGFPGAWTHFDTFVGGFFGLICLLNGVWMWKDQEEKAFVRLSRGHANPYKSRKFDTLFRVFIICTLPFLLAIARTFDLFLALLALDFYLTACDPLPPCEPKIKEMFKSKIMVFIPHASH